jgi:hypothetical protein
LLLTVLFFGEVFHSTNDSFNGEVMIMACGKKCGTKKAVKKKATKKK